MKWITPNNTFLIERDLKPISFLTGTITFEGKEYTESAAYYEIDQEGKVIKRYDGAYPFSIEDEMTISNIHLVIGQALYEFYWSRLFGADPRQTVNKVLENLRLYEAELPFDLEDSIDKYILRNCPDIYEPETYEIDSINAY